MELKELIERMEQRPHMFIHSLDIQILSLFIDAFMYGKSVSDNLSPMDQAFQKSFSTWIQNYYDAPLNQSWSNTMIYFEGIGPKSYEIFFDLYKRWYDSMEVNMMKNDDTSQES